MTNLQNCDNKLCIYWQQGRCLRKQVCVTKGGLCGDFILISFDDGLLRRKRRAMRERYHDLSNQIEKPGT